MACGFAKPCYAAGVDRSFLPELCEIAIGESDRAYPELDEKRGYILKVIAMEEERFDATVDAGLSILSGMIEDAKKAGEKQLSGEDVFRLYDTFGFPIDLTREIAGEAGLTLDDAKFDELMKAQKVRAREARANISGWSNATGSLIKGLDKTVFTGYEKLEDEGRVLAILADGMNADEISEGECSVILDRTPFYGEGGGQVGDTGTLTVGKTVLNVTDTKKSDGVYIHLCTVADGILKKGDTVTAAVDAHRRMAIMRNHSACHLLQSALRRVLGSHVEQAGSYVSDTVCRFDFTHFAAMTPDELAQVEALVNADIFAAQPGSMTEMPIDEAKKLGAMALFGEKYGKTVRVVRMGGHSIELCGGTHTSATGNIGLFKILSESAISAGVRRIEAVTGEQAEKVLYAAEDTMRNIAEYLNNPQVVQAVKKMLESNETLSKEVESMRREQVAQWADKIAASTPERHGMQLFATQTDRRPDFVKDLAYNLRQRSPRLVFVVGSVWNGKPTLTVMLGDEITACGVNAGAVVREAAKLMQGGGGGQAFFATAGGKNPDGLQAAIDKAVELIGAQVK